MSEQPSPLPSTAPPRGGQRQGPTLDRLAILDDHGNRQTLHPADVAVGGGRGVRLVWRRRVFFLLIGVFLAVPWIEANGEPLIRLDIPRRSFHLFGLVFNSQDGPLLFLLFSAAGFALIVASALIGRLWCGWTCPQTVLLEGVFRRIERFIDGPGPQRRALEAQAWSARKLGLRTAKWSLWTLVALVLVHTFLGYFVGARELVGYMVDGPWAHPLTASFAALGTAALLFDMTWFREQLCLIVCPYGRLQSVLADEDTFAIGYDKQRGEPRGKATDANAGACVDCQRCVVVCPTGIDIRNGMQLDCIGCGQCADACDEIMVKLHRPKGLVRTDSLRGLRGEARRFVRPRIFAYLVAGLVGVGVAALFITHRTSLDANIVRAPGAPYVIDGAGRVTNPFFLHVVNRSQADAHLDLSFTVPPGIEVMVPQSITLSGEEQRSVPVVVSAPKGTPLSGKTLSIKLGKNGDSREVSATLLGPS